MLISSLNCVLSEFTFKWLKFILIRFIVFSISELFALYNMLLSLSGMPTSLLDQAVERLPSWHPKTANDVFCLVKAFVSDNELSQPPLLVLPGAKIDDMMDAFRKLASPSAPCSPPEVILHCVQ